MDSVKRAETRASADCGFANKAYTKCKLSCDYKCAMQISSTAGMPLFFPDCHLDLIRVEWSVVCSHAQLIIAPGQVLKSIFKC